MTSINKLFLDLADDLGLTQTVNDPTRGDNILDLFFTNNINFISKTSVVSGVSDHQAVTIESKLSLKPQKTPPRVIQLWDKADINKLKTDCKNFNNLFKYTHSKCKQNIKDMWPCIQNNLLTIQKDNIPTKTTASKIYQPWITTQTKRLIRKKISGIKG